MKIKEISRFYPVLILIISILINIGMFFKYYEKNEVLFPDEMQFDNIALSILSGKSTYSYVPGGGEHDIGDMIMPGYPFLLAIIYFLFGQNYLFVYIFQATLSTTAALLFFHIMKRHVHSFLALIAAVWLLLYYPLWSGSFSLMRESISVSILIISLYYIDAYFKKNQNKYLYIFAFIFGILISINNRFIIHFVFLLLYLFFLYLRKNIKFKPIIICSIIVFFILLPWHIRQYIVYDQVVLFSPIRTEQALGNKENRPFLSFEEYRNQVLNSGQNEKGKKYFGKYFTKEKFEEMKKNYNTFSGFNKYFSRFLGFLEIYNNKIRFGFGGDTRISIPSSNVRKYTNIILFAPMILFFIIGFAFSLIKRNKFFTLMGILIFAHILLHSYVHYIHRYRLTIIPLIFILGWYGIDQIIKLFHKYHKKEFTINQEVS